MSRAINRKSARLRDKLTKILAERLSDEMDRQDVTQLDLASSLGITRAAISLLVNGNGLPSILTLCQIADELDVSVDYLLGRDDSIQKTIRSFLDPLRRKEQARLK